jgi:hypothetical protein
MRSVSVRARGVALLLFIVLATAVPVLADERPPGTEPPEHRIHVPVGATSAQEQDELSVWDLFLIWLQHRIHVPVG